MAEMEKERGVSFMAYMRIVCRSLAIHSKLSPLTTQKNDGKMMQSVTLSRIQGLVCFFFLNTFYCSSFSLSCQYIIKVQNHYQKILEETIGLANTYIPSHIPFLLPPPSEVGSTSSTSLLSLQSLVLSFRSIVLGLEVTFQIVQCVVSTKFSQDCVHERGPRFQTMIQPQALENGYQQVWS